MRNEDPGPPPPVPVGLLIAILHLHSEFRISHCITLPPDPHFAFRIRHFAFEALPLNYPIRGIDNKIRFRIINETFHGNTRLLHEAVSNIHDCAILIEGFDGDCGQRQF